MTGSRSSGYWSDVRHRRGRTDQKTRFDCQPLLLGALLFGLMLGLRAWLQWAGPLPIDRSELDHYAPHGLPGFVFTIFSGTEFEVLTLVLVVAGAVCYWHLAGKPTAVGFVLSAVVVLWNGLLKSAFGPAPYWRLERGGIDYPSGHMAVVTAIFAYTACVGLERRRPAVVFGCAAITVFTGIERILSGAHTVSDVLGGALLGLSWTSITFGYVHRFGRAYAFETRRGLTAPETTL